MKKILLVSFVALFLITKINAQITTSASISGFVKDSKLLPLAGATVIASHLPSGTIYKAISNDKGYYSFNSVRVGGPYTIEVRFIGLEGKDFENLYTDLGITSTVDFVLNEKDEKLQQIIVSSNRNQNFSTNKTGAAQQFGKREILSIPTIGSRNISDITRYNSQTGNGSSFAGGDPRYNNFTIDGSILNDNFGLGSTGQAGARTGIFPISIDAIEQIQVNIAPYDVRQSGFTGAGINAVTRSGTNEIEGSAYYSYNDNTATFLGTKVEGAKIPNLVFRQSNIGGRIGFPIIKNKLFGFVNFENYERTQPANDWFSTNSPNSAGSTQISRPTYGLLDSVSKFLASNYGINTGPFENYNSVTKATKFLAKIDWNINENNKINLRVINQISNFNAQISNSRGAGLGNRIGLLSLSYMNSGYLQNANTFSVVAEWNSKFSNTISNNFYIGYDFNNENRGYLSPIFPLVDIAQGGTTLLSFGTDPFTPSNQLQYSTLHATENITIDLGSHKLTAGFNWKKFNSLNVFFPASNGVYSFNSIQDFYTAAAQSIANNGAPSTIAPALFQLRYSKLPNNAEPQQNLEANRFDFYFQDEHKIGNRLTLLYGIRTATISFGNTAYWNPYVDSLTFNNNEKYSTLTLPKTSLLFEPRFGFNWDILGTKKLLFRGGAGVFTGRPPYVYISNQVGNNGVLTGLINVSGANAAQYGFTPNPAKYYTPANSSYDRTNLDLAFTSPNYKFPQVFKFNAALDYKLPFGLILTAEYNYNNFINAVNYNNANFNEKPSGYLIGSAGDVRPIYNTNSNRTNSTVTNAIVLGNRNGTYSDQFTFKIELPLTKGFYGYIAYTRTNAKEFLSTGSIAASSWTGAQTITNNNDLSLSNTSNLVPDRIVGLLNYRIEYGKPLGGATTISLGFFAQQAGVYSYNINGDLNRDGINGNDLAYVPTDAEINLLNFTTLSGSYNLNGSSVAYSFTPDQQKEALKSFIAQNPYLKNRRGQYAERNGALLPFLARADLSIIQDIFYYTKSKNEKIKNKHALQVRFDIINFTNLLSNSLGVSKRATNTNLLTVATLPTASSAPIYRFATQTNYDGTVGLLKDSYQRNTTINDVWQMQLTVRYFFGK